jgi:hypothetical protein
MTSVRAVYERGRVRFVEPVPRRARTELIVLFLDRSGNSPREGKSIRLRRRASWPDGYFSSLSGVLNSSPIRRISEGKLEKRKILR